MRPLIYVAVLAAALAAALAVAAVSALAQEAPPATPSATVTVSGLGEIALAPDMATVSLGVTTTGGDAASALAANSEAVAALLAALKNAGIEPRDIQTASVNLNPRWANDGSQAIVGYEASNQVTVRVRELPRLGEILNAMIGAGANTLNGLSFGATDPRSAEDAARQKAVADARAKAELYAAALGMKLGPVISVSEGGTSQGPTPMYRAAAEAAPVPIAEGELSITASVSITWALVAS